MTGTDDPTGGRLEDEFVLELMLAADPEPMSERERHALRDERHALGLLLVRGGVLRKSALRADVPEVAFRYSRQRVGYMLSLGLLSLECGSTAGDVADAIDLFGADRSGLERRFLHALAEATQALLTAQRADEEEVRRQYVRAITALTDRCGGRQGSIGPDESDPGP